MEDVLVIGGGPAGLAAAIAARLLGFRVTVSDAAHPPIDKACGEGILPAGVDALRRLGVSLDDGAPFRGIRFLDGDRTLEVPFRDGCGMAIRRTRLHDSLVRRASGLGVRLLWDTAISRISDLPPSRWIVGADGQHSRVRHDTRLDATRSLSVRYGFRRHYQLAPWTDRVEVHWGKYGQVYVTPVSPGEIGVALLTRDSHLRLDDALCEFPALQRRLRSATASSTERGSVTTSRRLRRVYRDRTVLIGDASGSVDAITGDGLSLSFLQAFALAKAMAACDLEAYQQEHRRLAVYPSRMAKALLLMDRLPWLRPVIFGALAFQPSILSLLLAKSPC